MVAALKAKPSWILDGTFWSAKTLFDAARTHQHVQQELDLPKQRSREETSFSSRQAEGGLPEEHRGNTMRVRHATDCLSTCCASNFQAAFLLCACRPDQVCAELSLAVHLCGFHLLAAVDSVSTLHSVLLACQVRCLGQFIAVTFGPLERTAVVECFNPPPPRKSLGRKFAESRSCCSCFPRGQASPRPAAAP